MAEEQVDDLEAEVDEGAEFETERFADVSEDDEEAGISREPGKPARHERAAVDDKDDDASDTI